MKKFTYAILLLSLIGVLAACGKSNSDAANKKITIAASPAPHGEVLEHAKKSNGKKGLRFKNKNSK
ncbi:putative lipoprotein [Staphylococcus gallinarum]|uniref:Putative lipoprotein n=1 Tax=Staphylococcus gallinarum TaxID=1293 RepID=A0A380FMH9_STAGA|nr:putative lipoprotein [Staphylococcus gallinarum]